MQLLMQFCNARDWRRALGHLLQFHSSEVLSNLQHLELEKVCGSSTTMLGWSAPDFGKRNAEIPKRILQKQQTGYLVRSRYILINIKAYTRIHHLSSTTEEYIVWFQFKNNNNNKKSLEYFQYFHSIISFLLNLLFSYSL